MARLRRSPVKRRKNFLEIIEVYQVLSDIVNADNGGDPYTGEELRQMVIPALDSVRGLLPESVWDEVGL